MDPFDGLWDRLQALLSLKDGWDSYGAASPSPASVATAGAYLAEAERQGLVPARVGPSAMGGAWVAHRNGLRRVYVECYNGGAAHALFSDRGAGAMRTAPVTPEGLAAFVADARAFLDGETEA